MPLVTVILSTYNWSSVLPFSIQSVLNQTFPDFELLVVGDGCTDDSADVVAKFNDSRVRWINLPRNTGTQAGPNNEGLRQALANEFAKAAKGMPLRRNGPSRAYARWDMGRNRVSGGLCRESEVPGVIPFGTTPRPG